MAVIIQADPYQLLMRKIGYSVGLEAVVVRSSALADLYSRERQLTASAWKALVAGEFGRKDSSDGNRKAAYEHIADFFSTIQLLKLLNHQITPLHGLEVLSILYRILPPGDERMLGLQLVVLTYLLEADGDILLNLLQAGFDETVARDLLVALVRRKREFLSKAIRHPALQQKIFDLVAIKNQVQSGHKRTGTSPPSRFARRQEPLAAGRRTASLTRPDEPVVDISEDYMGKAIQTRKGWCREFKLFGEKELTEAGRRLLNEAAALGLRDSSGAFLFWPFTEDLRKLQIEPSLIGAPALREWDLLTSVASAISGVTARSECDEKCRDLVVGDLMEYQHKYREGNRSRGSIRHQLPLYIAQPVIVAVAAGRHSSIPPLPAILEIERASAKRRVNFTNIRGTEGGISVKD
jgi:hypothetical protein